MALIHCTNCGKEISSKAKNCPHCGQEVFQEQISPLTPAPIICEECGKELTPGTEVCPNCGCPVANESTIEEIPQKVEVTSVNLPPMSKNKKKYLFIGLAAILAILVIIVIGNGISEKKAAKAEAQRKESYASTLETASLSMLMGAIDAEEAGNLIKSVWYNSIYEERDSSTDKYTRPNGYFLDDFNDALSNLFSDNSFSSTIDDIEDNQELVAGMMKRLKNPPDEYEDAYDAIKELYEAYMSLTNLVTSPSGSLQTFSQNFNEADSETANCYDTMKMYLD